MDVKNDTSSSSMKTSTKSLGYVVSGKILNNCRKNSLENFTNDLLEAVFTDEELGTSSVTGKKCNANKDEPVRPQLDVAKLEAVKGIKTYNLDSN